MQDVSAAIPATRDFGDERKLGLTLTADTLTGASASGAIALDAPQTFTSPSGRAVYTTPAGEVPLDDTFLDTRFALNASWTQPLARLYTLSAGLGFSTEYDYTHLGANLLLARDFNKRNTTLSAGVAWSQDDIDPVGGAPIPLSQMLDVGDNAQQARQRQQGRARSAARLHAGAQSHDRPARQLLLQRFERLSERSVQDPERRRSADRRHDRARARGGRSRARRRLPSTRAVRTRASKHSLYAEMKHAFGAPVLHCRLSIHDRRLGHRLAHRLTCDCAGRSGAASYIEPQLRYYTQSEADFYRASLGAGQPLPQYASADFRLGDFDAVTRRVSSSVTALAAATNGAPALEYYQQTGEVPPRTDHRQSGESRAVSGPECRDRAVQLSLRPVSGIAPMNASSSLQARPAGRLADARRRSLDRALRRDGVSVRGADRIGDGSHWRATSARGGSGLRLAHRAQVQPLSHRQHRSPHQRQCAVSAIDVDEETANLLDFAATADAALRRTVRHHLGRAAQSVDVRRRRSRAVAGSRSTHLLELRRLAQGRMAPPAARDAARECRSTSAASARNTRSTQRPASPRRSRRV